MNLDALIRFYHDLSIESVARFPEFYADDAWFKDPFNEVRGIAAILAIHYLPQTRAGMTREEFHKIVDGLKDTELLGTSR